MSTIRKLYTLQQISINPQRKSKNSKIPLIQPPTKASCLISDKGKLLHHPKSMQFLKESLFFFLLMIIYKSLYSMNTLLWNQKKSLMNSRMIQNKMGVSGDFQEMVEKQLNDDFKVHEYLSENQSEEYSSHKYMILLNTLLVEKKNKNNVKDSLLNKRTSLKTNPSPAFITTPQQNQSSTKKWQGEQNIDTYYSQEEYLRIKEESEIHQQEIELKTREELQMRKILWKEINDKKKSLDLLKGDIGHMIARNESISVLESKVNKVKLVSENQYKRVSIAFSKDKEEIQLRQEMQKKFHNKLKSFGTSQSRNLKKAKFSYIEMMNRRKEIYEKLAQIEQEAASIELYSDKQKQFKQKNVKTLSSLSLLSCLCTIIEKVPTIWQIFINKQISHQKYCQLIKEEFQSIFLSSDNTKRTYRSQAWEPKPIFFFIDDVQQITLTNFLNKILTEHRRIQNQIEEKKKVYNEHIRTLEELNLMDNKLMSEQCKIVSCFAEEEKQLILRNNTIVSQYYSTLRHFQRNLKLVYLMIDFLNEKFEDHSSLAYISQLYAMYMWHHQTLKNWSSIKQFPLQQKCLSQHSIELYHDETQQDTQNDKLFRDLNQDIKIWFEEIKQKIGRQKNQLGYFPEKHSQEHQNQRSIQTVIAEIISSWKFTSNGDALLGLDQAEQNLRETPIEDRHSEKQFQLSLRESKLELFDDQFTSKENENILAATINNSHSEHVPSSSNASLFNEKYNGNLAKRVQLLENIDQRYYKMIKDTLEMEKENTRKNYQFQKNFKRTKYSTQDQLLEEKRFESTFSGLFKQDAASHNQTTVKMKHSSPLHEKSYIQQKNMTSKSLGRQKIKLSQTFHTRSFYLLKKCKEEYMQRLMNSRNGYRTLAQSKHQNLRKVKLNCWKKIEDEEKQPQKKKANRIISSSSKKNFHLKLQQVIDLY